MPTFSNLKMEFYYKEPWPNTRWTEWNEHRFPFSSILTFTIDPHPEFKRKERNTKLELALLSLYAMCICVWWKEGLLNTHFLKTVLIQVIIRAVNPFPSPRTAKMENDNGKGIKDINMESKSLSWLKLETIPPTYSFNCLYGCGNVPLVGLEPKLHVQIRFPK